MAGVPDPPLASLYAGLPDNVDTEGDASDAYRERDVTPPSLSTVAASSKRYL